MKITIVGIKIMSVRPRRVSGVIGMKWALSSGLDALFVNIDFEKAHDRVEWSFILAMLKALECLLDSSTILKPCLPTLWPISLSTVAYLKALDNSSPSSKVVP